MSRALSYLSIAKKAGAIEIGETNSGAAVRSGKAKLLALARDASENALSRARGFVHDGKVPLTRIPFTKQEISKASGASGCSMAAFTDLGLAAAFMASLAEENPEFESTARLLAAQNDKAAKRKIEDAAHAKNKRFGKAATEGMRRKQH